MLASSGCFLTIGENRSTRFLPVLHLDFALDMRAHGSTRPPIRIGLVLRVGHSRGGRRGGRTAMVGSTRQFTVLLVS